MSSAFTVMPAPRRRNLAGLLWAAMVAVAIGLLPVVPLAGAIFVAYVASRVVAFDETIAVWLVVYLTGLGNLLLGLWLNGRDR